MADKRKLTRKIMIKGTITAETGLRIGGNKSSLEIGGVDLNVIKTGEGIPYIPGSSLKGKMRSLLARVRGSEEAKSDPKEMQMLFGASGADDKNRDTTALEFGNTRLSIRDAMLDTTKFKTKFGEGNSRALDFEYSEIKTENNIDRSRGTAQHPRQVERVPAGAIFNFDMVLDIYTNDKQNSFLKLIKDAFELLELDYLGGHGTRGSGKVLINDLEVKGKNIDEETGLSDINNEACDEIMELLKFK